MSYLIMEKDVADRIPFISLNRDGRAQWDGTQKHVARCYTYANFLNAHRFPTLRQAEYAMGGLPRSVGNFFRIVDEEEAEKDYLIPAILDTL